MRFRNCVLASGTALKDYLMSAPSQPRGRSHSASQHDTCWHLL